MKAATGLSTLPTFVQCTQNQRPHDTNEIRYGILNLRPWNLSELYL